MMNQHSQNKHEIGFPASKANTLFENVRTVSNVTVT
jgi:hypothetical protein